MLLVPTTEALLQYQDLNSGLAYSELCYQYEFVASHILLANTEMPNDQRNTRNKEFTTLNGKKVLIRYQNSSVVTGKGFDERQKAGILETNISITFNDYLKGSSYTPVIFITRPLCGDMVLLDNLQVFSDKSQHRTSVLDPPLLHDSRQKYASEFEHQIQSFPDVGERLALTFHLTKARIRKSETVEDVKLEWIRARDSIHQIVLSDKRLKLSQDIKKLVYDYVESKLCDRIQQQLGEIMYLQELEQLYDYKILKNLSLNQVSTIFYPKNRKHFSMHKIVSLEILINNAVECFKTINNKSKHEEKLGILISTMKHLSVEIPGLSLDADSLLGLFVLVICRSQVSGLKSTFQYLYNFPFTESSIKFGLNGYVMSTFEAVLSYCSSDNIDGLSRKCLENKHIWDSLKSKQDINVAKIEKNLDIRTDNGESLIALCIQNHNTELLVQLLANFENEIPFEDIFEDKDYLGSNLLIQALQSRNFEAIEILSTILTSSCSEKELKDYLNSPNFHKRVAAHYFMEDISLLDSLGQYCDWEYKDINGHTPLFAIFRSYDTSNYDTVVKRVFDEVVKWYGAKKKEFDLVIHEDFKGNTLLHVIKSNVQVLLSLPQIDVNKPDQKGLTPLMTYSRYNRISNILALVNDNRLIWDAVQQPLIMTCLDCTKNPQVGQEIISAIYDKKYIVVHSLRHENKRWSLFVSNSDTYSKYSLKLLQLYFQYLKVRFPLSFQPTCQLIDELQMLGIFGIPSVLRLQCLHTFKKLNFFLSYMNEKENMLLRNDEDQLRKLLDVSTHSLSESERFVKLEPEEVSSIQGFLKFNQSEFQNLKSVLIVLRKLVIVEQIKRQDLTSSKNMLFSLGKLVLQSGIAKCFDKILFQDFYGNSYHEFIRSLEYVELCLTTILLSIESLLQKTTCWWKFYGDYIELKKEYKKNFPNDNHTLSTSAKSIIDSYIESKRSKLRHKLSTQLKMSSLKVKKLGGDIKTNNETIAVEIGLFLEYKEMFYSKHIIEPMVSYRVKECKETVTRLLEMKKKH